MVATFRTLVGAGALLFLAMSTSYAEVVGVVQSVTQRESEATVIERALRDRVTDGWYRVRIVSAPDEVVLQGQVDNQRTRESVIAAARAAVSRPIRDDLKVQPLVTDQEIAAALKRALEQEYPGLATKVQISVNDAIVHLRGDLKNHRDVDRILAAAMGQKGVQDIQSDITVRGHAYPMSRR